jgi:hypothetical protein
MGVKFITGTFDSRTANTYYRGKQMEEVTHAP